MIDSRVGWRIVPAVAGAIVAIAWSAAQAKDRGTIRVERLREFDGHTSNPIDLKAVEKFHKTSTRLVREAFEVAGRQRIPDLKSAPYSAGLPTAFSRSTSQRRFEAPVPERLRGTTVYFVSVAKGGAVPPILSGDLPKEALVLVVDAESIADISRLGARVKRPISLATADIARRLGVTRRDSRVTIAADGRTAEIEEVRP